MKNIEQNICVITGSSGGIGQELARAFSLGNYKVIGLDVVENNLQEIDFIKVNLQNENEILAAFKKIEEKYKHINVLVNNAGITKLHKNIMELSTAEFDSVIDVNLRAAFICSKEFIRLNTGQAYGRIINIASTRYNQNEANYEAYGSSKGGLVAFTNSLAISLSDTKVTVNAVSPGWICTENYEQLSELDHSQHPSGRVGKPCDIANACLFLADVKNDFVNAHNLIVDGGMTKKMIYVE